MASNGAASFAPAVGHGQGHQIVRMLSKAETSSRKGSVGCSSDGDGDSDSPTSKADDWKLMSEVKQFHAADKADGRSLGVTWNNLTVKGISADTVFNENAFSQFNIPQLVRDARQPAPLKTIVDSSYGCVKPGEMLLVLGRPGSGCTSLLKILANRRAGYAEIEGDVHFGSLTHKEAESYRGQIAMNTEEELFFPTLTVGQTMDFATRLKVPDSLLTGVSSREEYRTGSKDFLLRSMGIAHTELTMVGNEFVRGVSGGERKRVSIIETLTTRASVFCWDNSTRGLDASTALEYIRAVRALTDELGLASIVTLYQASNSIYNLFDKVLVLEQGKQIYYGPRSKARGFMEDLGFVCDPAANTADFMTGVVVPTERSIRPGYETRFPRTADAIRDAYENSSISGTMTKELDYPQTETASILTAEFERAVLQDKPKRAKSSLFTVSFGRQVQACIVRQYQILWGDKETFILKQGSTIIQALIAGSLFYAAPDNSSGLFIKGGALFFSLLFHSLLAMSEVIDSFFGRPILAKHKSLGLYNPAAFCIAQIATDLPIILFQVSCFSLILYFMVGLKLTAAAFFTYWFVVFITTFVMTAFFRACGAAFPNFDAASKASGFAISCLITFVGYEQPKPFMHPWFVWIYWINPLSYGFESLMGNEFRHQIIPCVNNNLVPNGPGFTSSANQACAGVGGAPVGATTVTGEQYLRSLSYSPSHVWRNVGILIAWWVFFVAITIFFTIRWGEASGNNGFLLIPRENQRKVADMKISKDEESQIGESHPHSARENTSSSHPPGADVEMQEVDHSTGAQLVRNTSVFTWRNLTYTVKTPSGDRILLDNVQGYVKPGMLGALMGSSGAGKTTLLDVLAQRKTDGTIKGEILVDGRPLTLSFQRSAGYCEQLDVHEGMATVREALEFSALLRQSRDTPRAEKLAYVDTIINLLEMHDIENMLIGKVGAGLSIEQRKRLTIGVELVSKPSILIFLDEPTSGLDGQAAFNTVRFLRKLAAVGQAVLVTIHQPSAQLFAQFDTLLLLQRGGKTVYFGDIGDNASTLKDYFKRYDAPCPESMNVAEHMIDVVSGSLSQDRDWNKVWLESPEHQRLTKDLDSLITDAANKPPGSKDDGFEFAMPLWEQTKIVTHRMNKALFRNNDYTNNKFALHVTSALFNGFTFWMIGNTVQDNQFRLFALFNFIFVAPGVMAQLQPLFIERRDIYEAREKKSKMYHWSAFVTGLIVSELPYLVICAILYFFCFYYTAGFPSASSKAGSVFFVMLIYEFIYTGIGQFVAAYAPNATFAALVNPLVLGILISFCGVLVPYSQIQAFWRYWIYYLNPFNYLMGSLLVFTTYDTQIECAASEFAVFDPPAGETCAAYLGQYLQGFGAGANLTNPAATTGCRVCQYRRGSDYLATINLPLYRDGWRDAGICALFAVSSYSLVYLLMKLRTKASKKAE